MSESTEQRPEIPQSGIIFGDIIYWVTIVATVIVLIGSVVTFLSQGNYIEPSYLLSAIWEGKNVDDIWKGGVGVLPEGHWYLEHITKGDGMTTFGLALGVFSVIPAIFGASYYLLKDKDYIFAGLAIVAALITMAAVVA